MYEKWKSTSQERHHVCKFTSGGERFFIDDFAYSEYYSFLIEPQRKSFASNLWSEELFTAQFRVSKELKISAITQHDFQYQKLKASAWTTIKPLTILPVQLRMLVENTLSKHVNHLICRWNLFCTFRLFFSLFHCLSYVPSSEKILRLASSGIFSAICLLTGAFK